MELVGAAITLYYCDYGSFITALFKLQSKSESESVSHSVQFSSVTQLCPTLCNPINCSMPGLPVHHQLLEFTQTQVHRVGNAIQPSLSHVQLFVTPWTVAHHAPLSMGFSRQEYWSGLPFPAPRDLPDPGIESRFSALQANTLLSEPQGKPATREAPFLKNLPAMQETQIRSLVRKIP